MKELVMITRPENLEDIKSILDDVNCGGMTLSTVMGCGTQKGMDAELADAVNEIKGFKPDSGRRRVFDTAWLFRVRKDNNAAHDCRL